MTHTQKMIGVGVAALLCIAGAFAYSRYVQPDTTTLPPSDTGGAQTDSSVVVGLVDGLPEGASAQVVGAVNEELYNNTPRPSVERALPRGNTTAEVHTLLIQKRALLVEEIQKNPAVMQNWLALGTVHKQVDDFEGARIYYTYVATVNPRNLAVHWNLGTLYELYLKNTDKAIQEFKKVIELDPTYIPAYTELATVYMEHSRSAEAVSILTQGLSQNKGSTDLLIARAHLYRASGETSLAKADYAAAINLTQKDNPQLAAQLTAEMNAL